MNKTLAALLACCLLGPAAQAAPYRPATAGEVLEKLPARLESRHEIRDLRRLAAERPADSGTAFRLVRRYIELGRAESDPRYYGYAEAALAPWLGASPPAPEALVLSATLHQSRHEFPAALADLSQALARQPRLAQAWLTRAVILEVQGDYPGALQSCLPLARLAPPLTAATCANSALSLSGQGAAAFDRLARMAQAVPAGDGAERQWALTTLAEIAARLGRFDEAERQFQAALALPQRSSYLLATYADFLLDRQRPAEAARLLQGETRADSLLLRLALAEQRLGAADLPRHVDALQDRFAASRLRGDATHQGDEARFRLHLLGDAQAALALAQANWTVQREPRDARILLEAAAAAGNRAAARGVLDALARSGLEDPKLAELSKPLREDAP
jgi:Tfp pilus assembly protein PilF